MSGEQDIASLGLKVESSQVKEARKDLDSLSQSASKADQATQGVAKASETAASAVDRNSLAIAKHVAHLAELDPRVRTAATLFSHLGASFSTILGIGAAVAVVIALTKAFVEGARESETLAKAIFLSGNAAGINAGQLALMAQSMARVRGTQHEATEALAAFAATGKVGAENLEKFASLAARIQEDVGIPIEDTAKQFAALADKPTEAAVELQKSFNFLTPAVYDYIRAQEKAGNTDVAAAAAQSALAGAQERALKQVEENIPPVVAAWRAVKEEAAKAWDTMLGIGRQQSPEERLKELQDLRGLRPLGGRSPGDVHSRGEAFGFAGSDAEEKRLVPIVEQRKKDAAAQAEQKKQTDAYLESQLALANGIDEADEAQKRINAAWLQLDASDITRKLDQVKAKYDGVLNELDARRNANLITDQQFFEKKRDILQKETDAEILALRKSNADLLNQDGLSALERISAQDKIAANNSRITTILTQNASQMRVLHINEVDALKKERDAYIDAQQAADRYVETLTRRFQIESQGIGLGDQARKRLQDQADLDSKFEDRRQELDKQRRAGDITRAQYDQYLKIEQNALDRSKAAYDKYYEDLKAKQGNWVNGAHEAFANFRDDALNVAKHVEDAFTRGLNGLTDAIVNFAMTGKLNFHQLADSFIADLLRIEIQILESKYLAPIFSSITGAVLGGATSSAPISNTPGDPGFEGPPRAKGGPVQKGVWYPVNENTPRSEWWMAPADGVVSPTGPGMGGTTHNTYYIGAGVSRADVENALDQRDAQLRREQYDNKTRGRGVWGR